LFAFLGGDDVTGKPGGEPGAGGEGCQGCLQETPAGQIASGHVFSLLGGGKPGERHYREYFIPSSAVREPFTPSTLLALPPKNQRVGISPRANLSGPVLACHLVPADPEGVAVEVVDALAQLRQLRTVGEVHVDGLGVLARIQFDGRLVGGVLDLDDVLVAADG